MKRGDYAASLLALAGMCRLGLEDKASVVIDSEVMVPSSCQGIVGITVRASDTEIRDLLGATEDKPACIMATAERANAAYETGGTGGWQLRAEAAFGLLASGCRARRPGVGRRVAG